MDEVQVPPEWGRLTLKNISGTLMVIGAPDTGKSTFSCYLYRRLCATHTRVAFIDGDIGQSTLGPPTTMTVVIGQPGDAAFPPGGPRHRFFVGDNSPRGHMLPTLIGTYKLARYAQKHGATVTIVDTTGLVDRSQGGGALKRAKVDLLRPTTVFALQRRKELEHLLVPLRRSGRTRVVDLPVSPAVRPRDVSARRAHRAYMFRQYFSGAGTLEVAWSRLAVMPAPIFKRGQLVALEDVEGFALEIGVVLQEDPASRTLLIRTPARTLDDVDAIRVGDLILDPSLCPEVYDQR
jgi:polynucleotide 5'-hydroxyl-kinase GRC3/NOL9